MKKFLALVLSLAMILSLCSCGKKKATDIVEEEKVSTSSINAISYTDGNITLRFSSTDNKWTWVDDPAFPLDPTFIDAIIEDVALLESMESTRFRKEASEYGLEDPVFTLTVSDEASSETYYFGEVEAIENYYYMCTEKQDVLYHVDKNIIDSIPMSIHSLAVLPTLPTISADSIKNIQFKSTSVIEKEDEEDEIVELVSSVYHSKDNWTSHSKNVNDVIAPVLEEIEVLSLNRCVDFSPSEGVMSICGLSPAQFSIEIRYINSVDVSATLKLTFGSLRESDNCYFVTMNSDSTIYAIYADSVASICEIAKNGI